MFNNLTSNEWAILFFMLGMAAGTLAERKENEIVQLNIELLNKLKIIHAQQIKDN